MGFKDLSLQLVAGRAGETANAAKDETETKQDGVIVRNDLSANDEPDRFITRARQIYSRSRKPRQRSAGIL